MYGHWTIPSKFNPEMYAGFIYIITNCVTDCKYIGKKNFHSNGKWKSYLSSSKTLKEDINTYGKENFIFEIVELIKEPDSLILREAELQIEHDVLNAKLPNGNPAFYNKSIACRALDASGACRDNEFRQAISRAHKGRTAPNKGVPCADETKLKISKANKGKKRSPEVSDKLSKLRKGKPQTAARIQHNLKQRDNNVYTWSHPEHGIHECSKWDFAEKFNLDPKKLSPLITGRYRSYYQWTIL